MNRAVALALIVTVAPACSRELAPEGQIVLGVATDAWLPRGPDDPPDAVETAPLFSRLRVELFAPGDDVPCPECTRDFDLDARTANEGSASVGFVPRAGVSGYRARVRVYRTGPSESYAEPRPRSTMEAVVALPVVAADGVVRVHVVLHTADLGAPRGTLDAPIDPEQGDPPTGLAGTWSADVRRTCAAPAGQGEACVPGGAFWMGDPAFAVPYERLVAISPFYLDVREVTVGEVRASGLATLDTVKLTADPYLYSADASKSIHWCTYTQNAGAQEDMPVNCVTRDLAARYCAKIGKRLPTEAEIEFASGARRNATYPWGETTAGCDDAVFARSYDATKPPEFRACASVGVGAARAGSGKLDRVRFTADGAEVVDLAGNLAEWVADAYEDTDEPCFAATVATDPLCTVESAKTPSNVLVRSSAWSDPGGPFLRAAVRSFTQASAPQNPRIGFRCAR